MTETEVITIRKCPHCGQRLEVVTALELKTALDVRVRGVVPAVERRLLEAQRKLEQQRNAALVAQPQAK